MNRLFCRGFQLCYHVASNFLPWRHPVILENMEALAALLLERKIASALIVTDAGLVKLGLIQQLVGALEKHRIPYAVYDRTVPNPTIGNIEEALVLYRQNGCEAIIALGGGSPMDCGKGVGARVARPDRTIPQMKGQLKVGKKMPLFVAVPTTAGTGSETTLAAVITDEKANTKYAINDPALIPHYAVLDPVLTQKLPPPITAATGMDALCHAVEAYIGRSNTATTRSDARKATRLIFDNLLTAYRDGNDLTARKNMQSAAYAAGAAFTRAFVGNIHAIAHALGGQYHTPHGVACTVVMPYVLEAYGKHCTKQLSELYDASGLSKGATTMEEKSAAFIAAIRELNQAMGIPDKIEALLKQDIPTLVSRALAEANPLYPVPKIFDQQDMQAIFLHILTAQEDANGVH